MSMGRRSYNTSKSWNTNSGLTIVFLIIIGITVFGGLSYGAYSLNRWFNWNFSYQSEVQQEI
jgi:ABC-type multidrug transport system permease subunit